MMRVREEKETSGEEGRGEERRQEQGSKGMADVPGPRGALVA